MRTRTLHCVIALAAVLATMPAQALAQNLVRGTVKDQKEQPVEGALIHFEAIDFVNKRDVKTDKKGEYLFQGLSSGDYNVTASKDGVGTHTRKYNVNSNSARERVDFFLVPVGGGKASGPPPAGGGKASGPPPPAGLESLNTDAAAVAKGKDLTALQVIATAAIEAQKAGNHDEAVAKFSELLVKVPDCSDCYIQLGVSYFALTKLDEAEAAFKKSISVRPSVEAYTALARIYNGQKKFDEAAEATKNAAELSEKLTASPSGSAPAPAAATAPGAPAPGAAAPGAAAGAAPPASASSETLFNQGVILWNTGKYAEAKTQFEAAVKVNPANAEAQYQLGMANLNVGQIPAARAAFEAYLKVAPDGPKAGDVKTFLKQLPK